MSRLKLLYDTTVEMLTTLEGLERDEQDREVVIHKIDELIVKREAIIAEITSPYTNEEIKVGQQVVQLNEQIKEKMDDLYKNVQNDMKKIKQKKDLNLSYINPYGKIQTTDGMYIDSKN